jgi:prepilin signal peptidase PulO-like enzyme (type II secretory pathway)
MGDTKLFAVAGLALPVPAFLIFAALAGAAGVLLGLIWRWRVKAPEFPFAPAVLFAFWVALVAAGNIMDHLVILSSR